jgi:hypothetical protein
MSALMQKIFLCFLTFSASRQAHDNLPVLKTDASSSDRTTVVPLTIDSSTRVPPDTQLYRHQTSNPRVPSLGGRQIFTARPSQAYRWPDSLPFNERLSQHCGDLEHDTSKLPEEIRSRRGKHDYAVQTEPSKGQQQALCRARLGARVQRDADVSSGEPGDGGDWYYEQCLADGQL